MATRKTTKRPARRPRATPGPVNQTRGAGEAATASAAATKPFYAPDSGEPTEVRSAMAEHLADVAHDAGLEQPLHVEEVRAQAIPAPGGNTADHSLARKGLAAEKASAPEPGENLEDDIARVRAMRRPLGAFTQRLALAHRAGYHSHWFNSEGGRIDDALANGWAHRKDADGKPLKRAVGRGTDQGVLYAYAMDLPEQFWLEDTAAKHQAASDKMEGLKAAPFQAQAGASKRSDQGKFYSPVEGREPLEIEKI